MGSSRSHIRCYERAWSHNVAVELELGGAKSCVRKWIRIAVALLLVGAVLLLPRSETEVHKRRCQAAWDSLGGKSMTARIKRFYRRVTNTHPRFDGWQEWDAHVEKLNTSRAALLEVGYLVRQRVHLSHGPPSRVEDAFHQMRLHDAFVWIETGRNYITVIAPRDEILAVSNALRRIDATGEVR
jgi:hypothetical protein